ncbi:MAG: 2-oxoglutarate dehydrogenase, E2 component, dihydrolipoamide succinyltransferase [Microlunatus sp.]|nr:2-oxoglutarate dehydrogenase, E2 component, dihydrolipoamide succinyltransferase [Microlunatus sp.]
MSTSVTLPALGESVTEGTVTRWLKQVGDAVEADEPLLEVSTDKVDTEIPSPVAGVLLEIKAAEDETVEVGGELAVIGDADEAEGEDSGGGQAQDGAEPEPEKEAEPDADADAKPETSSAADEGRSDETSSGGPAAGTEDGGGGSGTEVTLPALGESVTEGTVTRWLKQVGDTVEADEPLLEVSTDKVDTEIPSPLAGTVLEIRVDEDETVEVGAVLAVVGEPSEAESAPAAEAPQEKTEAPEEKTAEVDSADTVEEQTDAGDEGGQEPISAPKPEQKPAPAKSESEGGGDRSYVTPLVRKLAAEHSVDLSSLKGTGVGGRIRKQDVLAAAEEAKKAAEAPAEAPAAAPAPPAPAAAAKPAESSNLRGTTEKMSRLRKTIAKRMVESLQVSAQLTATVEVDLTVISRLRAQAKEDFKAREGASLSYLPFITRAAIEALKVYPKVNATIDTEAGEVTYPSAEHIGIAVDTERGLLVPVIKDAGDLNIGGLAKKIADLAARTRQNKVTPDELSGGTFTITNYGSAGTLMDSPIINQPQVAILGTGALVKRPMVIKDPSLGEVIAVRDMMYLSMSYDHRIVDGADAARFLSMVKARLDEGDFGSEFGL